MSPPTPTRTVVVSSLREVEALEVAVRGAAEGLRAALAEVASTDPLEVVRALKYGAVGRDPLEPGRALNAIDQVQRTFAALVTIRGAAHLLRAHPEHAPYRLHFGSASEPDIRSDDGEVVAETVAVVSPVGNRKLEFDLGRMRENRARHRYLFYHAHDAAGAPSDAGVRVVPVDL